jgi:hypothetical protein
LRKELARAWFTIRLLERKWSFPASFRKKEFYLNQRPEDTIKFYFDVYKAQMQHCRQKHAEDWKIDMSILGIDGHQKTARNRLCCMQKGSVLRSQELGKICLTSCCETVYGKEVFCPEHQKGLQTELQDKRVVRIKWTEPIGAGPEDLGVVYWKTSSEDNCRRGKFADVTSEAVNAYMRQLSLEVFGATSAGEVRSIGLEEITDDMTLETLAGLKCETHKMKKKASSRRRRCARSAGFLVAVTPAGFVAEVTEFIGAESLSQRYFFLATLKRLYPQLAVVLHDDACHLRAFAQKRSSACDFSGELSYPKMKFILDRFHASGHKDDWCLQNVHPAVPENAELVEGVNTSACEILFSWLARFKRMVKTMGQYTALFFVEEMLHDRNVGKHAPKSRRVAECLSLDVAGEVAPRPEEDASQCDDEASSVSSAESVESDESSESESDAFEQEAADADVDLTHLISPSVRADVFFGVAPSTPDHDLPELQV